MNVPSIRRSALATTALVALVAGAGCAGLVPSPSESAPHATEEWVAGPVDLQKTTALVRVTPPPRLKATLETIAARTDDEDFGDFLRATASGGFGSGFLVVHRDASGATAAFVVTNRHVVTSADQAEITFGDGTTYKSCEVVYVSKADDVAVLALPDAAVKSFGGGLRPVTTAPSERNVVVATGYPGIAGRPSFQITEGKVSNARFSMPELGLEGTLVQHTAPIDPGSSGGPLTNEKGEVVGVNVMLLRSRNAAFFAVPASAVVSAVRRAHGLLSERRSPAFLAKELDASCASLAADLSSPSTPVTKVRPLVSNQLVADAGLSSYVLLTRAQGTRSLDKAFYEDPIGTMRASIVMRLVAGSGSGPVTCAAANAGDLVTAADGNRVRVPVHTANGDVEISWRFELGAWRIVGFVLPQAAPREEPAAPPVKPTKAPAKLAARKGK